MPKITAVESCTVRIPLDNPTTFATRKVLARELTLVAVEADDGHRGIGFTYGGNRAGGIVTDARLAVDIRPGELDRPGRPRPEMVVLDYDFEGVSADYLAPMPKLRAARGRRAPYFSAR